MQDHDEWVFVCSEEESERVFKNVDDAMKELVKDSWEICEGPGVVSSVLDAQLSCSSGQSQVDMTPFSEFLCVWDALGFAPKSLWLHFVLGTGNPIGPERWR
jgi:hypothetical protein